MVRKITFERLIEEIENKWEKEGKEYIVDDMNLFDALNEIYSFVYYEKKWPIDDESIYYPSSKSALYNFIEKLFKGS